MSEMYLGDVERIQEKGDPYFNQFLKSREIIRKVNKEKANNNGKVSKQFKQSMRPRPTDAEVKHQAAQHSHMMKYLAGIKRISPSDIEEAVTAAYAVQKGHKVVEKVNQKNTNKDEEQLIMTTKTNQQERKLIVASNFKDALQSVGQANMATNLNIHTNRYMTNEFARDILLDSDLHNLRPHITVMDENASINLPLISIMSEETIAGTSYSKLELDNQSIYFAGKRDSIIAEVSETIMELTPLNLTKSATELMKRKMANKEMEYLFGMRPSPTDKDYSIFSTGNGVEVVSNTSVIDGIEAALSKLSKEFKVSSKVVMTRADYKKLVNELASLQLGGISNNPERYLGVKEIIINDDVPNILIGKLEVGVLGNLNILAVDVQKDADTGIYKLALSYMADYKFVPEALKIVQLA